MRVIYKPNGKVYTIYHIRVDNKGYPHFLIKKDNQWIYISAKYFDTLEENV